MALESNASWFSGLSMLGTGEAQNGLVSPRTAHPRTSSRMNWRAASTAGES